MKVKPSGCIAAAAGRGESANPTSQKVCHPFFFFFFGGGGGGLGFGIQGLVFFGFRLVDSAFPVHRVLKPQAPKP